MLRFTMSCMLYMLYLYIFTCYMLYLYMPKLVHCKKKFDTVTAKK